MRSVVSWCLLLSLWTVAYADNTVEEVHFQSENGQSVSIDSMIGQGRWTIIKVWGSDCAICATTAHHMVDFQDQYGGDQADVLGIAVDGLYNRAGVDGFIASHDMQRIPQLMDNGGGVAALFLRELGEQWIGGTPTYFLFDPEGGIAGFNYGPVRKDALEEFLRGRGVTL